MIPPHRFLTALGLGDVAPPSPAVPVVVRIEWEAEEEPEDHLLPAEAREVEDEVVAELAAASEETDPWTAALTMFGTEGGAVDAPVGPPGSPLADVRAESE